NDARESRRYRPVLAVHRGRAARRAARGRIRRPAQGPGPDPRRAQGSERVAKLARGGGGSGLRAAHRASPTTSRPPTVITLSDSSASFTRSPTSAGALSVRSEEHTSELQSHHDI